MIAHIYDEDGKYLRTVEGSLEIILLSIPDNGIYREMPNDILMDQASWTEVDDLTEAEMEELRE